MFAFPRQVLALPVADLTVGEPRWRFRSHLMFPTTQLIERLLLLTLHLNTIVERKTFVVVVIVALKKRKKV